MNRALDEAWQRLHAYGCELRNGLTNHAPMVAEALHHLGLDEHIQSWVDAELPNCEPRPAASQPIDPEHWQSALGEPLRFADWARLIEDDIAQHDWQHTVQTWTTRLTPGFATAAAHGVIRTAHAVRALTEADTDIRRTELADAFASWACHYAELPVEHGEAGQLTPSQALAALPPRVSDETAGAGSITAALSALQTDLVFARHFHALDVVDDLNELTLDVAATFARLFCRSAHTPLQAIVFTHAITGTNAVRLLAPFLDHNQHQQLLLHAFHTGCALHRVYSEHTFEPPAQDALMPGIEECVYDALAHGDEHVIKLTDACVDFTRITGDGTFLAAAEQCRRCLPPRG